MANSAQKVYPMVNSGRPKRLPVRLSVHTAPQRTLALIAIVLCFLHAMSNKAYLILSYLILELPASLPGKYRLFYYMQIEKTNYESSTDSLKTGADK